MIFPDDALPCKALVQADEIEIAVSYTPPPAGLTTIGPITVLRRLPLSNADLTSQIAKASSVVPYADAILHGNAARVAYAQGLAASHAFDADPDFAPEERQPAGPPTELTFPSPDTRNARRLARARALPCGSTPGSLVVERKDAWT